MVTGRATRPRWHATLTPRRSTLGPESGAGALDRDLPFEPRERRPQTDVRVGRERHMRVRRREIEENNLPGGDGLPTNLQCRGGLASREMHRGIVAQDFFHGAADQLGLSPQQLGPARGGGAGPGCRCL